MPFLTPAPAPSKAAKVVFVLFFNLNLPFIFLFFFLYLLHFVFRLLQIFFFAKNQRHFFSVGGRNRDPRPRQPRKKGRVFSLSLAGEPFILGNLACVRGVCELVRGSAWECVWECAPLPPTFFPTSSLASLFFVEASTTSLLLSSSSSLPLESSNDRTQSDKSPTVEDETEKKDS